MKNLLNKIFGISQRSKGEIDAEGKVTVTEIVSYDLVANPPLSNARIDFSYTDELIEKIRKELERQKLLKTRKDKLNKLNNIE